MSSTRPVAVVVGAGPGLGLASARAFAAAGHDVALVGRREGTLAGLAAAVEADGHGTDVGWTALDVADSGALAAAVERFARHTGRLDVLHHNVSVYRPGGLGAVGPAELLEDLAVGAGSLLAAVDAARPHLAAVGGTVLLTGSGAADHPDPGALTLGPQKAAVRALLVGLAPALAAEGVHAATLTVRGMLRPGTAFDPDRVAARLLALADERHGPREGWTVEHEMTG
ncbi:SDR family oxidoreductase [Aquipuribacter hungaricus]|uniref:SDR family oxidoreductase n=2 Tax=Aquipuribacter hungaricus TaxID=545624 RepID=A0ABV7WBY6_9MICO